MFKKKQELNITPKPTKNKTKEALKATQAKEAKEEKVATPKYLINEYTRLDIMTFFN